MNGEQTAVFLAAGDLHAGLCPPERTEAIFRGARSHPDAAFMAVPGDLTNASLPEQYALLEPLIASLPFPFYASMGNHDALPGGGGDPHALFCRALGLESPNYVRDIGDARFVFLSSDGSPDGCTVVIERGIGLLETSLRTARGPVVVFCHAPLTGTIGGVPGRPCFLSDDEGFGLSGSATVRHLVEQAGRPVVWVSGHTHTPVHAGTLIVSETVGGTVMHHVNVSSPFFTGRDWVTTEPLAVYRFELDADELRVRIEDAETGGELRSAVLAPIRP